jgi:hypothetical protein
MKVIIDPHHIKHGPHFPSAVRRGFTYLHGELENHNGYDIFGVNPAFNWEPGIYPCEMIGYRGECFFYLWMGTDNRLHGLVVASTDVKGLEYATKCYKDKTTTL